MVKRGKTVKSEHSSSLWKKHALGGGRLLVAFSIPLLFSWFIASSVIVPTIIPNASATESTDKNTSTSTTDKGYSLSISVPKTVTIDLIPNPSGSFSYSELNTLVSTTNPTGYSLSFNSTTIDPTNPGTTTNPNYISSLIHTNTNLTNLGLNNTNTIPSISSNTTYSDFPTNTWGYSTVDNSTTNVTDTIVESLTFKPIPLPSSSTSDKQLKVTTTADNSTTPTVNTNTKLIIGLKANNDLSSGSYIGQLTFNVVTNALPPTFSGITNMQQMTSAICAAETTPSASATITTTEHVTNTNYVPEATLIDTRDRKTYVVRKLADGKCWMTQNLKLGGSSAITLTSANSDVSSNFTLAASSNSFGATNDVAGINIVRVNSTYANYWIDDKYTSATQVIMSTGTPASQTQYIGNYYNWYTATAGTGTYAMATIGVNATSSICPKGWRLPKSGAINASTGNGELQILYNVYSLTNDAAGSSKMRKPPISAVYAGTYQGTTVVSQGSRGGWWSSTAFSNNLEAYNAVFAPNLVLMLDRTAKRIGSPMRCVAR